MDMKFGMTNTDEMGLDTCFDVYSGDEDFDNAEEIEELARISLSDMAGLIEGSHFTLYVNGNNSVALVSIIKVCAEENISITLMHPKTDGSGWQPQTLEF